MTQVRTIKKYPNRRLYDSEESRYITLADVRRLVIDDISFTVIDQKTGDDITRNILLQVISEEEATGEPIMTRDFLAEMIRAYGRSMPGFVGSYLEQSLQVFLRQQQELHSQMVDMMGMDPMAPVRNLAQQNWKRWLGMQQEMWRLMLGQGQSPAAPSGESADRAVNPRSDRRSRGDHNR